MGGEEVEEGGQEDGLKVDWCQVDVTCYAHPKPAASGGDVATFLLKYD